MQDISQDFTEAVALAYARRGWPVLILEPGGKLPNTDRKACPHGVKDATTDQGRIRSWLWRFPRSNIGIATGAPGPTVQDVDDLGHEEARSVMAGIPKATPTVVTPGVNHPPGRHFYFAGLDRGTADRDWGELRGRGSYVVAPPSVIDGTAYRWAVMPNGPLPELPAFLVPPDSRAGAGRGKLRVVETVPAGQRHNYLKDFAVRLLRGGITDRDCLEAHLYCEYDRVCEPGDRASIPGIVAWAVKSHIAERERARADFAARWNGRRVA